ncbi:MAG: hypothetical protein ABIH11_06665 [Candidatus Altiarchaeota archaeon]
MASLKRTILLALIVFAVLTVFLIDSAAARRPKGCYPLCKNENTPMMCRDGKDNDGDGYTDCSDPQCKKRMEGFELGKRRSCKDGIDNDCDGYTDCRDADCIQRLSSKSENVRRGCTNRKDDDCDGKIDCDDPDCVKHKACKSRNRVSCSNVEVGGVKSPLTVCVSASTYGGDSSSACQSYCNANSCDYFGDTPANCDDGSVDDLCCLCQTQGVTGLCDTSGGVTALIPSKITGWAILRKLLPW